ncbi:unnamed protein product [Oncorhynchus mykiss]|uniref:2-acylglycerol O-acyltransferase 1 n=1 Tax=Oncorhynchus mykiss TaxID=8022 RepID=A0A060Y3E4_ONCMY|nr:unnamed protein product [Oncorhynchus mykiss]
MPIFFCTSICLAQCCFCVYVVIVLNGYWHVAALYALWLYLDWDTPQAGGRRSDWVRHWTVWKHFGDYFPIHLIKTCDLDPERNYLMGFHPHGILVAGAFGNFCTEYTGFRELYPGMTPYLHTLGIWFSFPFFREGAGSNSKIEQTFMSHDFSVQFRPHCLSYCTEMLPR